MKFVWLGFYYYVDEVIFGKYSEEFLLILDKLEYYRPDFIDDN